MASIVVASALILVSTIAKTALGGEVGSARVKLIESISIYVHTELSDLVQGA
jgi:hypothetical protein